jgi:hypothetical protein
LIAALVFVLARNTACQQSFTAVFGIAASRGQIIDELLQRFVLFPIAASQWCATTRTIVVILQPLCDTLKAIALITTIDFYRSSKGFLADWTR